MFPEIGLKREKFFYAGRMSLTIFFNIIINNNDLIFIVVEGHWTDLNNRRRVFEDYAKSKGFDPLIPKFWYSQHATSINSFKVFILFF